MASNVESKTLVEFASARREFHAWVDELPDDVFNQIWDGAHGGRIGKEMAAAWLRSLGYADVTAGRVQTVMTRERR